MLDVGSGTGILSIFAAQAGAKKVFAVEASSLAELSKEGIKENGLENIIEVFHGKAEDFRLPDGISHVDIIVSEFMGFYLLHEGMLDSVLMARERFLKPGGFLFPDRAIIYLSPCAVPSLFDDWENVSGIKMTKFAEQLRKQKSSKPEVLIVQKEHLLADDIVVAFLDLNDISPGELDRIDFNEVIVAKKDGKFQGVCLWFEVLFPSNDMEEDIVLSTHPQCAPTHWKQTVVPLPENIETVEPLTPIAFKLVIQRHPENYRHYNLILEILDPDEVEHPLPCDCHATKCILSKAHLASLAGNGLQSA